jgi:hypothetical protein
VEPEGPAGERANSRIGTLDRESDTTFIQADRLPDVDDGLAVERRRQGAE